MNIHISAASFLTLLACTLITPAQVYAETIVTTDDYSIQFETDHPDVRQLTITGPNGFYLQTDSLLIFVDEPLTEGTYTYQISAPLPGVEIAHTVKQSLNDGRSEAQRAARGEPVGVVESGRFHFVSNAVPDASNQ